MLAIMLTTGYTLENKADKMLNPGKVVPVCDPSVGKIGKGESLVWRQDYIGRSYLRKY